MLFCYFAIKQQIKSLIYLRVKSCIVDTYNDERTWSGIY